VTVVLTTGSPAVAWSRRFFQLSRPRPGSIPVPAALRAGPAGPMTDGAGPHSAGRPEPAGGGVTGIQPEAAEPGPAVLLLPLALADALLLAVPEIAGRLTDGFGPA
jgi:hypothetical protein